MAAVDAQCIAPVITHHLVPPVRCDPGNTKKVQILNTGPAVKSDIRKAEMSAGIQWKAPSRRSFHNMISHASDQLRYNIDSHEISRLLSKKVRQGY
jgi:hypothetical protein